jgi:hypothetical protein
MAIGQEVTSANNNNNFYQWLKSSGKLGVMQNVDPSGISQGQWDMWHTMYDEEYKGQQTVDKMGDLSSQLLDPNSKFYQSYANYLQKTTPGIGANTLLAPLMAGGVGYAGGQAIANKKMETLSTQRQDKINTGVQGFALQNIGTGAGLLGQQGNLGLGWANLQEQKRQYDDQNSGLNGFFGMLGQGFAMLNPFDSNGGGGGTATKNNSGVQGYGRF